MVVRTPIIVLIDDPDDSGERADVVLGRRVAGLSRRMARRMALQGLLRINARAAPPSTRVRPGDRLELVVDPAPEAQGDLAVVRTTDDLVFVDKPPGMHTHRLRPDDPPSLADAVARAHPECADASPDPRQGGALHRLDYETSGVVTFARHVRAWEAGRQALAAATTLKLYVALCTGSQAWPPPGRGGASALQVEAPAFPAWVPPPASVRGLRVSAPLGHGATRATVAVRPDARRAETWIWPVARVERHGEPPCWWLALRLLTGRRHQARVHLAHLGLPIVGDRRYGRSSAQEPMWLRACSLTLAAPHGLQAGGCVEVSAGPGWDTLPEDARLTPDI